MNVADLMAGHLGSLHLRGFGVDEKDTISFLVCWIFASEKNFPRVTVSKHYTAIAI